MPFALLLAPEKTFLQSAFWLPDPDAVALALAFGGGHPRSMWLFMDGMGTRALQMGHGASSAR